MNFNIEVRKRQLQSLDQYISSSRNRLLSILNHLGWNAKQISEVCTTLKLKLIYSQ